MNKNEFRNVLQGAVAGSHRDLELLLELYAPMIRKYAHVNGVFNPELLFKGT